MGEGQPGSSSEVLFEALVCALHPIVRSDVLWICGLEPKPLLRINPDLK